MVVGGLILRHSLVTLCFPTKFKKPSLLKIHKSLAATQNTNYP